MNITESLKRIEEGAFKNIDSQTQTYNAIVTRAIRGTFNMSYFAAYQVIMGSQVEGEFVKLSPQRIGFGPVVPLDLLKVLGRLAVYMPALHRDFDFKIVLEREEVEAMKILLEARMRHCEVERDAMAETFNPDTYISQKLLLLDIREWLMATSIEIGEELLAKSPKN